jgi:hypothetical protein
MCSVIVDRTILKLRPQVQRDLMGSVMRITTSMNTMCSGAWRKELHC